MFLFNNDDKLDKKVAGKYPGKWNLLEISSENSRGQNNSYNCARKIAESAKSVEFPIIIGVRTDDPVSTDGTRWSCLIRVGWPSEQNIADLINSIHIQDFGLGRVDIRQNTEDNYQEVLSSCTALDWKKRKMRKVWRCNY